MLKLLLGWLYTAVKYRMWSFSSCVQERFPFILEHEALWRAVFNRLELIYCLSGAREGMLEKNISFKHHTDSCLMLHLHVGEVYLHLHRLRILTATQPFGVSLLTVSPHLCGFSSQKVLTKVMSTDAAPPGASDQYDVETRTACWYLEDCLSFRKHINLPCQGWRC